MFKGHRWAMIGAMILWTFEKGYSLVSGINPFMTILWWSIYMHIFWESYKVEAMRVNLKKLKATDTRKREGSYEELEKLSELKTKGIITEEDFNIKKKQILGL
jgi:hypothetical protein